MFVGTAASFRSGSRPLPRDCYTSPRVLADEQDAIFGRLWSCAGRSGGLDRPGACAVRDVAGESLVVVRGEDGRLRAFFNVCRHRGTRLCDEAVERVEGVIRCPYHGWTYACDGRLVGAPHMADVEGFRLEDYPLHAAAVAEYGGFLFLNVSPSPAPFADWWAPMAARLDRFDLGDLAVGHRVVYDVRANWKLVFENYSECLHCPVIHPELARTLPYQSAANDLVEGPFLGGYMEVAPTHESVTTSGRSCGPAIGDGTRPEDRRRAYYYSVLPNMLLSVHPDYVNYYVLTPLAPDRTRVESEWLFRMRGGAPIDAGDAVSFWDLVNRQDWRIVERSQAGIASSRYRPGPYSPRESIAAAWDREYLRLMSGRATS